MKNNALQNLFLNKQSLFLLLPALFLLCLALNSLYSSKVEQTKLPSFEGKITSIQPYKASKRRVRNPSIIIKIDTEPDKLFKIGFILNRKNTPALQLGDLVTICTKPSLFNWSKNKEVVKLSTEQHLILDHYYVEKKISNVFFWFFALPFLLLFSVYVILARKRLNNNKYSG